jgi:crotonobetainyl-CoA:carnitine CoA-transferase CaiB-like acyl-CoA transferase
MSQRGGPLQGVRVIELTKVWAGPYVGKLFAFLGAEVIKIESQGSLDVTRFFGVEDINNAPGFQAVNPQKLSVTIDTKKPDGVQLALDLIATADIFVENLRPGAIDRMGLGYEAAKARKADIIYVSMGMHGNDGPLAYQTGYAPNFNAIGGISNLVGYEGEPPVGMNVRYADSTAGTAAAYAAAAALVHRKQTGKGQYVDLSTVECMTSMIGDAMMDYTLNGVAPVAKGNRRDDMAPHGVYPCDDTEWIAIAASSDDAWRKLANFMKHPADDARFATLEARKANEDALDQIISAFTKTRAAAPLAADLQKQGVAASKSQSSVDLIADETLWARGFYPEVQSGDRVKPIVGPSWIMSRGAALTIGAPALGEHNDYVFGELLGLSADARRALAESGAMR